MMVAEGNDATVKNILPYKVVRHLKPKYKSMIFTRMSAMLELVDRIPFKSLELCKYNNINISPLLGSVFRFNGENL